MTDTETNLYPHLSASMTPLKGTNSGNLHFRCGKCGREEVHNGPLTELEAKMLMTLFQWRHMHPPKKVKEEIKFVTKGTDEDHGLSSPSEEGQGGGVVNRELDHQEERKARLEHAQKIATLRQDSIEAQERLRKPQ